MTRYSRNALSSRSILHPLIQGLAALLLAVAALGLLGGCATLSEGQCLTADWYEIGRQDGRNGLDRARLHEHRKACASHGVTPDEAAYFAGRDEGLMLYCTPSSGFHQGREGKRYGNVCPPELEARFLHEYRKGSELYALYQAINNVNSNIAAIEKRLEDEELTRDELKQVQRDLRDLYREQAALEREKILLEERYWPPGGSPGW